MANKTMLKGKDAKLLKKVCELSRKKKALELEIANEKKLLHLDGPGTYTNSNGDLLEIVEVQKFIDIDPKKVFNYLKKNKMLSQFPSVVKVQVGALKKVMPEEMINKLRKLLSTSERWTFK